MILSALADYYQRLLDDSASGVAPPGYSQEKISFAIRLAENGEVVDISDLRDMSGKKPTPRLIRVPQPGKRASGIASNFLWDKTSYVLGVSATSTRCEKEHAAFKARHCEALAVSNDPGVQALLAFLDGWTPQQFRENVHFVDQGDEMLDANVVFQLDGDLGYLHDRRAARDAWQQQQGGDESRGTCLVTGEYSPLARLHPAIKGVNGAQSSGASIVSFNLGAFSSFGKVQGDNAPVSQQAAFAYTTALNHLLRRDAHNRQRLQIGDTTIVFWAQAPATRDAEEAESLLAAFLDHRDDDARETELLRSALQQIRHARPLRELGGHLNDGTQIFVLGLAPNASRLSVRFWETDTLGRFAQRLAAHYDDLKIEPVRWQRPPSPRTLARATAPIISGKTKDEDVSPLLAGELTRAILCGTRYPLSVVGTLVMRFRADGEVTGTRVALCKAVLVRDARLSNRQTDEGVLPVSLDLTCADPGYVLGRLFSTLESVQKAALGRQVNATIRDRYYGAASATPASIFPVLLRNAQNHLSKIRKEKAGLAVVLEKEIGAIVDSLETSFPRSLAIAAQGRFAIGYYHQTQSRYAAGDEAESHETVNESEGVSA
ncbi:type I-C CRISPR-associated protein Cas8c/Csd1 [Tahibacter amnicola]|uniref:Type I-C CRISPR-associated protein Cas8c/Csd1 n=1 Tax=Tahibacter amnicola TaxID=2976241 RepID=A0ABY6BBT2_9GAMM|nr:type I-C CRISPR-associated protein Cas8c/Csd1 [Tahibacter amnicola]UXI67305.1 type I-C CRISPR-associated protein Cas8c/Csd1 [Tahibacter amnicola]